MYCLWIVEENQQHDAKSRVDVRQKTLQDFSFCTLKNDEATDETSILDTVVQVSDLAGSSDSIPGPLGVQESEQSTLLECASLKTQHTAWRHVEVGREKKNTHFLCALLTMFTI